MPNRSTQAPAAPRKDLAASVSRLRQQFRNLDPNDPASWPTAPRVAMCLFIIVLIVAGLWYAFISGTSDEHTAEIDRETQLKVEYSRKLGQAVNLEVLRKQREQVLQYVTQLEKQLPGRSEMDALLSDINQAGLGRSLYFELFRPGQVTVKEYYAELPIALRVTGRYHDMGAFTSDIANLSRIVTLNNLAVTPGRDGALVMEATAKTFRYLDPDEIAAQRKGQGKK